MQELVFGKEDVKRKEKPSIEKRVSDLESRKEKLEMKQESCSYNA
jgi:hypothetical protein